MKQVQSNNIYFLQIRSKIRNEKPRLNIKIKNILQVVESLFTDEERMRKNSGLLNKSEQNGKIVIG